MKADLLIQLEDMMPVGTAGLESATIEVAMAEEVVVAAVWDVAARDKNKQHGE